MLNHEQVMQSPIGYPDSCSPSAVRRIRNMWLALLAVTLLLSAVFVVTSIRGMQQVPKPEAIAANASASPSWADSTATPDVRDRLLSRGMLLKWGMADLALVMGVAEISAALTLYLRALRRGGVPGMPGRRVAPNILRRKDREYLYDALSTETATGYLLLCALALGSAITAGFLAFDSATWILAAIISGNW